MLRDKLHTFCMQGGAVGIYGTLTMTDCALANNKADEDVSLLHVCPVVPEFLSTCAGGRAGRFT